MCCVDLKPSVKISDKVSRLKTVLYRGESTWGKAEEQSGKQSEDKPLFSLQVTAESNMRLCGSVKVSQQSSRHTRCGEGADFTAQYPAKVMNIIYIYLKKSS